VKTVRMGLSPTATTTIHDGTQVRTLSMASLPAAPARLILGTCWLPCASRV
jgi:hypothetical protein